MAPIPVLADPTNNTIVWPPFFWASNAAPAGGLVASLNGRSTNGVFSGASFPTPPAADGSALTNIHSANISDAISLQAGAGIVFSQSGNLITVSAGGDAGALTNLNWKGITNAPAIWKSCFDLTHLPMLTHMTASTATPAPFSYQAGINSDGSATPIMGATVPWGQGFSNVISTLTVQGLTGETNMTVGLTVYTKSYQAAGRAFNSPSYTMSGITNLMLTTFTFTNTFVDDSSPRFIDFDFGASGQTVTNTLQIIDWTIRSAP